jgi:hypothetical protein
MSRIKGIPSPFSAIIASAPARNGMADGATRFSAAGAPEAFDGRRNPLLVDEIALRTCIIDVRNRYDSISV